jgi:hypothetical protein
MGWPFSTVVAPSFDSGLAFPGTPNSVALATVPNLLLTDPAWLLGAHYVNTRTTAVLITVVDGSGVAIISGFMLSAGASQPFEWAFLPIVGLQWKVTDMNGVGIPSGVNAKFWGYK